MDDTFVTQKEENKQNFQKHINSIDLAIQFTVENNKEDGAILPLDTIVKPETGGKLSITVYRKPTHMDQYLQWDSHCHLSPKYSVISTLTHRAKLFVAILSFSKMKWSISAKHLPIVNTPNGLWTMQRKDLPGHPVRLMMGLTARTPQVPSLLPMKLNPRVIW